MLTAKETQVLCANMQEERAAEIQKRIDEGYLEAEMDYIGTLIEANAVEKYTFIKVHDFIPDYVGSATKKLEEVITALKHLGYQVQQSFSTSPVNETLTIRW